MDPVLFPAHHGFWRIFVVWYERHRQRRRLTELDDFMLRDIGVDRATAGQEARKPFWQA